MDRRRARDSAAARRAAIAHRREPIIGVSEYAHLDEKPRGRSTSDLEGFRREAVARVEEQRNRADAGASLASLARVSALVTGGSGPGSGDRSRAAGSIGRRDPGALTAALRGAGEPQSIDRLPARRDAEPFEELRDAADSWRTPKVAALASS